MTIDPANFWCVLRMAGAATLGVMTALREADFDAWAPAQMLPHRVGPKRKRVERPAPLLPTFVFARYDRLGDLLTASRSPAQTFQIFDKEQRRMVTKGCPRFSVMRHAGNYVAVPERSLDALRLAEQRGTPLAKLRMFSAGEKVKYPDAGFEGLVGVVETSRGRYALVCFNGFAIPVLVPTASLLGAA